MGSKSPSVTVVQPPPPQITERPLQPIPSQTIQESSQQLAESQLKYNPQLAQQSFDLYKQFAPQTAQIQTNLQTQLAPQLAQSEFENAQKYTPLYRALYEQLFPTQTNAQEALTQMAGQQLLSDTGLTPGQQYAQSQARRQGQEAVPSTALPSLMATALQQFESPTGLTGEQQAAVDAIRQRQRDAVSRNIRESANVGGALYGGQRPETEYRAQNELSQGFAQADIENAMQQRQFALQQLLSASQQEQGIAAQRQAFGLQNVGLQQQQRQQALQNLIAGLQVIFPQVQQPGAPQGFSPGFQSATPSPDALLQAILGQSQGAVINPAVVGFGPSARSQNLGFAGSLAQGIGSAFGCHVAEVLYGVDDIRTDLARLYVWTHNTFFTRLYRGFSDVWATWLRRLPLLQCLVRPYWNRMWRRMLVELRSR